MFVLSPAAVSFLDRLLDRLRESPEVEAAAAVNLLPLSPGNMVVAFELPWRTDADEGAAARLRIVTPGYLRAAGLRLLEGRWLAESDRRESQPVVVVSRAFVRAYANGEPLVGWTLPIGHRHPEVVGIVADVRHAGLDAEPQPEVYLTH